ncbi:MAG TPA: hypothetical protein VFA28_10720 [Bryobacteraceae bacterium]|jgi:hypothetical protein|nr:hypothetical protein [Bryobacteraceae bacterium]
MRARQIGNIAVLCAAFAVTVAVMLVVLPPPRRPIDYMVAGTVATAATLLMVFLITILPMANKREIFYRKRARRDGGGHSV